MIKPSTRRILHPIIPDDRRYFILESMDYFSEELGAGVAADSDTYLFILAINIVPHRIRASAVEFTNFYNSIKNSLHLEETL